MIRKALDNIRAARPLIDRPRDLSRIAGPQCDLRRILSDHQALCRSRTRIAFRGNACEASHLSGELTCTRQFIHVCATNDFAEKPFFGARLGESHILDGAQRVFGRHLIVVQSADAHVAPGHAAAGTAPRHLRRPSRLPIALAAAVIARRESGPGRAVLRELESDPTSLVAKAPARLGRALGLVETPLFSDLPT